MAHKFIDEVIGAELLDHFSKDDNTAGDPVLVALVGKPSCVQLMFSFYLDSRFWCHVSI